MFRKLAKSAIGRLAAADPASPTSSSAHAAPAEPNSGSAGGEALANPPSTESPAQAQGVDELYRAADIAPAPRRPVAPWPPEEDEGEAPPEAPRDAGPPRRVDRVAVVWRAKWWILLVALAAGAAAYALSEYVVSPTYEASATVRISAQGGNSSQDAVLASNDLASQYARLVDSGPVLRQAESALGLRAGALDGVASGGTLADQNLIGIGARAGDPDVAAVRANAIADAFVENILEANREQAAAYAETIDERLAPLNRRVARAQREVTRLSEEVAAGGPEATSAATLLAAAQSSLNSLIGERDRVRSAVAQVAAGLQPEITVWAEAGPGGQIQPKPVLYTVIAALVGAFLVIQVAVLIGGRRG